MGSLPSARAMVFTLDLCQRCGRPTDVPEDTASIPGVIKDRDVVRRLTSICRRVAVGTRCSS